MIEDLRVNRNASVLGIVSNVNKAKTKADKDYARFVLEDKTGKVKCVIWDLSGTDCPNNGDVLVVDGMVTEYNGDIQLTVNLFDTAKDFDESLLFRVSNYPTEFLLRYVTDTISDIQREEIRQLCKSFYSMKEWEKAPGAKSVHHGFVSGLLQHVYEVLEFCKLSLKLYPTADEDVVLASALLHDYGKLLELIQNPANRDYTEVGKLQGHLYLSAREVNKRGELIGVPRELLNDIEHCILSHHGQLEWGSPVVPATIEAMIVHMADLSSSRIQTILEASYEVEMGQWVFSRPLQCYVRGEK